MTTLSHEPVRQAPERHPITFRLLVPEMWAALAICVIWLAVLFDAVFGPDFVGRGNDGSGTSIPSAIIVALFAWLATRAVARYGFGRREEGK